MQIFELLDEQSSINFTGKINLLNKDSDQYIASVYLIDGNIVQCDFKQKKGLKALFRIFNFMHESSAHINLIIEPEIVPSDLKSFCLTSVQLKKLIQEFKENVEFNEKYRPSSDLRIVVDPQFLKKGVRVSPEEFEVLCMLSDTERVDEVYVKSELIDFEVTKAFIDLRKKGAIKVL
ncbi:MAG: hypothetical protein H6622_03595 [Halobacteriovoraceae bacterium]|nr:hypothetical protein [Halobacteriovoraceae bacterium]